MPIRHRVTMYRSKLGDDPVDLTYVEETLRRSQKRFRGRRVLTPEIDLDAYQWGALVDWIDIEFELVRRTQYWHLNDRIEALTGRKEFPEALDLGAGNTATRYRLRIQEPDFSVVRMVIANIQAAYGLSALGPIAEIIATFTTRLTDAQSQGTNVASTVALDRKNRPTSGLFNNQLKRQ